MSNRNIADLFGNSAVRPTEGNENVEQHENNNNETLQQHNDNVNVNVNKTLEGEMGSTTPEEPQETPTGNNDPEVPKDPTPVVQQDDILDFLKAEQEKKVVGFHLDKDVRQAFQKVLGKKPQRGAQSELANRIFRDFFEKRGLL
ncbi:hypothetical protein COD86_23135 [Bacillus cereus]|nr:hypothetical protein COD14_27650 [Bacillus cereus]PGV91514.1 hypothetical protein COD86_23135 [Bacillus cereus]